MDLGFAHPVALRSRARQVVHDRLRRQLPGLAPELMQYGLFWPHDELIDGFSRPPVSNGSLLLDDFPVPPEHLWACYCTTPQSWCLSGKDDVERMMGLLAEAGVGQIGGRILEFGCAAGRMLRWLPRYAPAAELWGADMWSTAILWCQDHMSPPCHFLTNTMAPHLPFESRSFDLIYCGSVFTHLDDLAETWLVELHRIIRPGGRLYFSINDRHSAQVLLDGGKPDYWERTGGRQAWEVFADKLRACSDFQRFMNGEAYMFTMGRSMQSHVMWDADLLVKRLDYGWDVDSITQEAYGHQTVVLLERR